MRIEGLNDMGTWDRYRAGELAKVLINAQIDLDDSSVIAFNSYSGYVYFYSELYSWQLCIGLGWDEKRESIEILITNPENGEEHFEDLGHWNLFDLDDYAMKVYEAWENGEG